MKLKNKDVSPHGGYVFYFDSPAGVTIKVSGVNSISQLTERVAQNMKNVGTPVPEDLEVEIQHQICLRQPNPREACWGKASGVHRLVKSVTRIVERAASRAGLTRIAKVVRGIGNCVGCSGKHVFSGKSGLGRAGRIDKIIG